MSNPPKIAVVSEVTREHGATFAEALIVSCLDSGIVWEACDATDVMEWPEGNDDAQERYKVLQDDICEPVLEAVRTAIAEAFVRIASEVLARERNR